MPSPPEARDRGEPPPDGGTAAVTSEEGLRWRAVQLALDAALDAAPGDRARALDEACGADVELRAEVERLLAACETDGGFLDSAAADYAAPMLADLMPEARGPGPGTEIAGYRIVGELAHGGMGAVYAAERTDGTASRVALKLVRPGLESERLIRRFAEERRILASMDHPEIARLLDGGVASGGVPYLVMELVEGVPIDRWCDERRLGIDARIRLFLRVCGAVGHAHERQVVHRDLKPANILVTGEGGLKLLDFGIAKLTADRPGEERFVTTANFRPMTPEFASPEQLRGEPVTAATDVYALGILLGILLCGHHPHRVFGLNRAELTRVVLLQPPDPPSRALRRIGEVAIGSGAELTAEGVAAARSTSPEELRRALDGPLDAIVLAALAVDPARRTRSAEDLAAAIRRHLAAPLDAPGGVTLRGRLDGLLRRRRK